MSSEAGTRESQRVAPFPAPDGDASFRRLATIVAARPRTTIVTDAGGYLHAESRSRIWRFVDDLELRLDAPAQVIHVRSAARLGRRDFNVNRERVEAIRRAYETR